MSCGQRQLPPAVAGAGDQRIGRLVLLGRHLEFLIEATGSAKVMAVAFCLLVLPMSLAAPFAVVNPAIAKPCKHATQRFGRAVVFLAIDFI